MESMLISQVNQKNVCSVTVGIFQIRALAMDRIFVIDAITCSVKQSDPGDFLKARFVIFRCQKC